MKLKQVVLGVAVLVTSVSVPALAQPPQAQYVQIAELEIDPAYLESYKAAVSEHAETAIRVEPGVLVLYSVSEKNNPARVTVFEVYRDIDAYNAHLETPHFRKYKATVEHMVRSLKLVPTTPISLAAKSVNPAGPAAIPSREMP